MSAVLKMVYAFLFAMTPQCAQEDSTNCHWEAAVQGNGNGYDYVSVTVGDKVVTLRGEWHGVDTKGRVKKDYPRPSVRLAD